MKVSFIALEPTFHSPKVDFKEFSNRISHYPADNILNKATEHGGYEYTYDDLSRLTITNNPVLDDEEFTHDDVGNRLMNQQLL